eukprot:COSAG01_NODE_2729_length_7175_cov_4.100198_3_plen_112_part_00
MDGSHSVAPCYNAAMAPAILWIEVAWHVVLLYVQEWDVVKAFGLGDCFDAKKLVSKAVNLFLAWSVIYPLVMDENGNTKSIMTASIHANVVGLIPTIEHLMGTIYASSVGI